MVWYLWLIVGLVVWAALSVLISLAIVHVFAMVAGQAGELLEAPLGAPTPEPESARRTSRRGPPIPASGS